MSANRILKKWISNTDNNLSLSNTYHLRTLQLHCNYYIKTTKSQHQTLDILTLPNFAQMTDQAILLQPFISTLFLTSCVSHLSNLIPLNRLAAKLTSSTKNPYLPYLSKSSQKWSPLSTEIDWLTIRHKVKKLNKSTHLFIISTTFPNKLLLKHPFNAKAKLVLSVIIIPQVQR